MSNMPVTAFAVFLVSTAIILAVFGIVARSTAVHRDVDYARANRLRLLFFGSLGVILLIFLVLTLPNLPYPVEAATPERVVLATGKQYTWSLTEGTAPTLENWDTTSSPSVTVPAGAVVEFRVTTLDVNHGFSLYTPDGRLMAQTQAMPGYVNRLRVVFDKPGTYTVLCLEFCGMSHHRMRGLVEVR
jgi:cytochrome c oxidase subunit II